jgi:hypothetical protein
LTKSSPVTIADGDVLMLNVFYETTIQSSFTPAPAPDPGGGDGYGLAEYGTDYGS